MSKTRRIFILFVSCLLPGPAHQYLFPVYRAEPAAGLNYFQNYSPHKEHDFQPQNWAVLQDKRGIIYIGNQGGLVEFDGVSWRLVRVPNQSVCSLAVDDDGTIYVGGENEIGFLAPGSKGTLKYVSLLHYLEHDKRNFFKVWFTYWNREGVYFITSKFLFRWDPKVQRFNVWQPSYFFSTAFMCHGNLYIRQEKVGLMQLLKDSLQLVRGGEAFAEIKIDMMVPYDSRHLLVGTRSKGFVLYDGKTARPFPTEADNWLVENRLYHGIRLSVSSGQFALATLGGGLVIIDSQGRIRQRFNKSCGLQDDSVMYVFEDSRGDLWLALSKGISRLEYASPVSFFDEGTGLPGIVLSVSTVKQGDRGILYAGTYNGLFYLSSSRQFQPVPGISGICWSLLAAPDTLLAAATSGVFQVDTGNETKAKPARQISGIPAYGLYRSSLEPRRIWVGTRHGLTSLDLNSKNREGRWEQEFIFKNIEDAIKTIVEDTKGNLWLGTLNRGVIKVDFPSRDISQYVFARYDATNGLPAGGVNVFRAAGHVIFTTDHGIFRCDGPNNRFIPDPTLGLAYAGGGEPVFRIAEDQDQNIWFHSRCRNFLALKKPDSTYEIDSRPFLRIPLAQVNGIYPDPGGDAAWFAGVDGLVRFDTTVSQNTSPGFSTYIRRVIIDGKHLIFDGYKSRDLAWPVLKYRERNLQFRYTAPVFQAESATRYRVFLEGYDQDWSDWTAATWKDYTNLDPGFYTFRVQAKDVFEEVGAQDRFSFRVLPPWYREWWAYLLYLSLVLLGGYGVVSWRSRKLRREKQRLELVVKDRTREIEEKNRQLETRTLQLGKQTVQLKEQSLQLKEMDRVKSRFFTNISHEFRTPLTLIIGPLEQIIARRGGDSEPGEEINLALRNSRRLLGLINQLLDLSRLESGKMKLHASRQEVIPFLRGIVSAFDSLAVQHRLDLTFQAPQETISLYFDAEKLERVIVNLISNAVKFTPAGGRVTVKVSHNDMPPSGYLEISVSDTGIGIPAEQLPRIFDRFYQVESPHEHKGTGIGLALARELVILHQGEILVHSEKGKGTEFKVRLPLGDGHLQPGEIIEKVDCSSVPQESLKNPPPYPIDPGEDREEAEEEAEAPGKAGPGSEEKNVILVVDDSADMRKYIRDALEPVYRVVQAVDGQQGIAKAGEILPDLIVSDIMMPGIDGFELCRVLKKSLDTSHIPVILLTARASEESVIAGLETGADDYITKPFNARILSARIRNLIDLRRQMHREINREMTLQPAQISLARIDKEFLQELNRMIEKNLTDPEFNVEALGKKLFMSRATLYRKILALTGETPALYVQSHRLRRAAQLLKRKFGSVTEVAFEVGFSSRAYFTKCFKEKFHRLPSEYRDSETA